MRTENSVNKSGFLLPVKKQRTLIKWLILVICLLLVFSFTLKKKKFTPPGTVQISETFFADEAEISNFAWCEYEWWIKNKYGAFSPEHIAALPDTLVWRDKTAYNEPYVKYYYRHFAYRDYPVVGISYEQAVAFCQWRTERVKEYYAIANKKELAIEYRLPTKDEWEFLTNNSNFFSNKGKDTKGNPYFNFRVPADTTDPASQWADMADVTAPIKSYKKNPFGIYNMIGNVAEMTSEKGIAKGGSWRHSLEECRPGKNLSYEKPVSWLGFRCVCVLKSNNF